jgi:hypothetical protein
VQVAIFKEKLLTEEILQVYNQYILDSDVWFFSQTTPQGGHYARYDEFKTYLSTKLEVHRNDIAIVGSAKLGFSLSPTKAYRAFQETSDIDIVIVSSEIFRKSWDAFLELQSKYYLKDYRFITSNIFRRFVSLKDPDTRNPFFDTWARKVEPCKKDLQLLFNIPNEINYRIYESWSSAKMYHCKGLEELRTALRAK